MVAVSSTCGNDVRKDYAKKPKENSDNPCLAALSTLAARIAALIVRILKDHFSVLILSAVDHILFVQAAAECAANDKPMTAKRGFG